MVPLIGDRSSPSDLDELRHAAESLPAGLIELLAGKPYAFISTLRPDGELAVVPVSPMFDGRCVWISTKSKSRKVLNLEGDPRVAICVVDPAVPQRYFMLRGRAVIEPDPDRVRIDELAKHRMGLDHYPYDRPGDERVVITIVHEHVSAPGVKTV